jgi:hypothetical protein
MRTLGDFSSMLEALPQWSKLSQIHKIELQVISDILIISVWTSAGMSQKAYTRDYPVALRRPSPRVIVHRVGDAVGKIQNA